jgi:hypothetical protein
LTSRPPRRSLYRLFRSILGVLPAAPLAVSLVSFPRRRLPRRVARCIDRSFSCQCLARAPFAASLVSLSCRRLAHRAARCIARFFLLLTSCPPRRSLYRLFLSLVL